MKRSNYFRILVFSIMVVLTTATAGDAHRCKPIDCNETLSIEYTRADCIIYVPGSRPETVDCKYKIRTYVCEELWCDINDVSTFVKSICTIEDQPPGSIKPRLPPEPCGGDPVSKQWKIVEFQTPQECLSTCWQNILGKTCLPNVTITESLLEEQCDD